MKHLSLLCLCLLVACGTPQEQCIAAGTRDLRAVEKLITEAQGNLQRGYAFEEKVIRFRTFTPCRQPPAKPGAPAKVLMCPDYSEQIVMRPKAIDLEEEARKLAQLQTKRAELMRAAKAVTAQCRAEFPE